MAVTKTCNVIYSNTNGDTVAGPLRIEAVKASGGSANGTITLSVGGNNVYYQAVTASTTPQSDEVPFYVGGGQTLTIALTGTGTAVYIYSV